MRKVLIIEDNAVDFKKIKQAFESAGWGILPEQITELKRFYTKNRKEELLRQIEGLIRTHADELGMVILDINLFKRNYGDVFGIEGVLRMIRTLELPDKIPLWEKHLPIVVYSTHSSIKEKKAALGETHHAHAFLPKRPGEENIEELLLIAESLYSIFALNAIKGAGAMHNFKEFFASMANILVDKQEAIEVQLADITLLINGGFNKIEDWLNLILNANITQMSPLQQDQFLLMFRAEIKGTLSARQYKLLSQSLDRDSTRKQIKTAFREGKVTLLFESLFKLLEENGASDYFPPLKTMGIVVTTLFKLISK